MQRCSKCNGYIFGSLDLKQKGICLNCYLKTKDEKDIVDHMPDKREQHFCEVCGEWFKTYEEFKVLSFNTYLQPSVIECKKCGTIYFKPPPEHKCPFGVHEKT